MGNNPLISVLMTSFNREKFIAEAIESVLSQTYKDFEFIISDDASTDKTFKIAQSYEKNNSCIKLFRSPKNLGQFQNRNLAATYANGDILVYVDSDDMIHSDALAYIADCFQKFPDAKYASIYKDSNYSEPFAMNSRTAIKTHFFKKSLLHIGPGGSVIKNELFKVIGGFPISYGPAGDMFYNIKAAVFTDSIILMPYDYLNYRRHDGQEINNSYSYLFNGYRYFDDIMHLPQLPLNEEERTYLRIKNKRRFIVNLSKFILKGGGIKNTIKAIRLAKFGVSDFFQGVFH
jgi:glycosyltransferase involved in cell wall biosynthesis